MTNLWQRLRRTPLFQLCAMHHRLLVREPSSVFFIFGVPLLLSLLLGYAFRGGAPDLEVAIVEGQGSAEASALLGAAEGLRAVVLSAEESRRRLNSGRVSLVLYPGDEPRLLVDRSLSNGRTARLLVLETLARDAGALPESGVVEERVEARRARYIDFLVPGLIAFTLMNASLFGVGFTMVQMRVARMLKRLVATPMRRATFLGSMLLTRVFQVALEVGFIAVLAWIFFDVTVAGSLVGLMTFAVVGAFSFAGIGMLAGSRTRNVDAASGILNLITVPMGLVSGVFFSTAGFPDWAQPMIAVLPLAALADGLRAIMVDGTPMAGLTFPLAVLLGWGSITYGLAIKFLRWE